MRQAGRTRALGLTCLALLAQSCVAEPQACTAEVRYPLTGDVFDKDGNAIVPDRVTVSYPSSVVHECAIEAPVKGASRFRCVEGNGTGLLTAYHGAEKTSKRFDVREEAGGCHALEQEVDLQFE